MTLWALASLETDDDTVRSHALARTDVVNGCSCSKAVRCRSLGVELSRQDGLRYVEGHWTWLSGQPAVQE